MRHVARVSSNLGGLPCVTRHGGARDPPHHYQRIQRRGDDRSGSAKRATQPGMGDARIVEYQLHDHELQWPNSLDFKRRLEDQMPEIEAAPQQMADQIAQYSLFEFVRFFRQLVPMVGG